MRLINNATLEIEYFMDLAQVPPYAILSHTWAQGEVTLQDFMLPDRETVRQLAGFAKIELACSQAAEDGLAYTWVDTCCIDKTSSAELSEAINSMYAWYEASAVCYVFLADLTSEDPIVLNEGHFQDNGCTGDDQEGREQRQPSPQFAAVRWFTRGWTLQELIAPATVRFFDMTWVFRGTKASLASALSVVTDVQESVLRGQTGLEGIPVARRMSWAARRKTTRTEDIAYCLLGIFNVNMPMLYGEGARAFIRLQEEIMRESNDLTLFAWRATGNSGSQQYRGLLALSPAEFAGSGTIELGDASSLDSEFSLTNKGVRFNSTLYEEDGNPIMPLHCSLSDKPAAIYLRKHGASIYVRAWPESFALREESHVPLSLVLREARQGVIYPWEKHPQKEDHKPWHVMSRPEQLHISKTLSPALAASISSAHRHGICFRRGFKISDVVGAPSQPNPYGDQARPLLDIIAVHPQERWDPMRSLFLTGGGTFTGKVIGFNMDCPQYTTEDLAVGVELGRPWVSFMDKEHPVHKNITQKGGLSGHDMNDFRSLAKEINSQKLGRWQVEITDDVLEGEPVFCVNLSLEPDEPEEHKQPEYTPAIDNFVHERRPKTKKKNKQYDGLARLFGN